MIFAAQNYLLRIILLSKEFIIQPASIPQIHQLQLAVKIENTYDPITSLSLLVALTGNLPQFVLLNRKQILVLPHTIISGIRLIEHFDRVVSIITIRLADKVIATNFERIITNKLSFVFKASDAVSIEARKLWKLLGYEVGSFSYEVTVVFNSSSSISVAETLLRGHALPVIFA